MRTTLLFLPLLAACTREPDRMAGLLALPMSGLVTATQSVGRDQRRGAVELVVKTNHPGIVDEIMAGGGPALTRAMDAAAIPERDRPARLIQLQSDAGLYAANPGALVTALTIYGR